MFNRDNPAVGASDDGGEDEPFEERFPKLKTLLIGELEESERLAEEIRRALSSFADV